MSSVMESASRASWNRKEREYSAVERKTESAEPGQVAGARMGAQESDAWKMELKESLWKVRLWNWFSLGRELK